MKENLRSETEEYNIVRLSSIKNLKKNFFSGYDINSEILLSIFVLLKKKKNFWV